MGSMNSNNWLSFPPDLSPNPHSSLPPHLQAAAAAHHFSLGLVNDNIHDNPFHNHGMFFLRLLPDYTGTGCEFESHLSSSLYFLYIYFLIY